MTYTMSKNSAPHGDLLLDWLVGRGGGSAKVLEDTLRWLCRGPENAVHGLRPFFWAREMEALGYLEIDRPKGVWAVAPATAVTLPGPDGMVYLTGGVSRTRLQKLDETLIDSGTVDACLEFVDREPVGGIPLPSAAFVLPSAGDTLRDVAGFLKQTLKFSPIACRAAARRLPTTDAPMARSAQPAAGSEVERLIPEAVGEAYGGRKMWRPAQWWNQDEPQLYRWPTPRVRYALVRDGDWWETGRDEGIYRALGPRIDVRFQEAPGTGVGRLIVPVRAQLPAPQERVAVLCSGFGAERSHLVATYANVPRDVASQIAQSLGLTLRIVK